MTPLHPTDAARSARARDVLTAARAVLDTLDHRATGVSGSVRGSVVSGDVSDLQDDMVRLISIAGALRNNVDLVPRSLIDFLA